MDVLKLIGGDLLFAFGLIVIGAMVLLLYRMSFLPKKSIPYVAAGLAGALGLRIFKKVRQQALDRKIQETQDAIDNRRHELEEKAVLVSTADEEVLGAVARLEKEKAAVAKERLLLEARSAKEKERIENMGIDELFAALRRT